MSQPYCMAPITLWHYAREVCAQATYFRRLAKDHGSPTRRAFTKFGNLPVIFSISTKYTNYVTTILHGTYNSVALCAWGVCAGDILSQARKGQWFAQSLCVHH